MLEMSMQILMHVNGQLHAWLFSLWSSFFIVERVEKMELRNVFMVIAHSISQGRTFVSPKNYEAHSNMISQFQSFILKCQGLRSSRLQLCKPQETRSLNKSSDANKRTIFAPKKTNTNLQVFKILHFMLMSRKW